MHIYIYIYMYIFIYIYLCVCVCVCVCVRVCAELEERLQSMRSTADEEAEYITALKHALDTKALCIYNIHTYTYTCIYMYKYLCNI